MKYTYLILSILLLAVSAPAQQTVTQNGITLAITDELYPHLVQSGQPFSILIDYSAEQPLFFRWFKDNSDASLSGNRTGSFLVPLNEFSEVLSFTSFQPSDTADYYLGASFSPITDALSVLNGGMFTNSIGALTPDFLDTADPTWSAYLEGNAPAPALHVGVVPEPVSSMLFMLGGLALLARRNR